MRRRLSGRTPPVLALGTIAVSSLALASCGGKLPVEDVMFSSVDQCVQAGMDEQVCRAGYQDAMRVHLAGAPRFDRLAACEAEYGWAQCTQARAADGSGSAGSFFIPFMAGYLLSTGIEKIDDYYKYRRKEEEQEGSGAGSGSGSGGGGHYGSSPIYKTRSGQTVTAVPVSDSGSQNVSASSRYSLKPVNVSTQTVARRGFGSRSFSFGLGG
ncbi:DUF1190 domain-containing protein [Ensifer adhaerens]|uniref:DUF1190 domain-containing protein n=1 Tax=Ensifer adhaerens TaxID=106592 RepID=UPI001CBB00C0|nr:DUF1190 domain-containing protein [Ensifer adhaerens]MBZ7927769.1 DUF1190 domain-containing protein [Ensifer adhaerens]UAX96597.1 DUF1190 domain-containing protein [Ensifer adhaerens]UAY04059.1 DUF1190 domain-containing protein [Ensifer adhaerens]UAY12045.1 DUF1190 domain-containing protein [Ensifer adhaerens]